jgi:hypothetical protein
MALRECRVTFREVRDIDHSVTVHAETTMDAAALGLKRIREQQFVMEDLADPVTLSALNWAQGKEVRPLCDTNSIRSTKR